MRLQTPGFANFTCSSAAPGCFCFCFCVCLFCSAKHAKNARKKARGRRAADPPTFRGKCGTSAAQVRHKCGTSAPQVRHTCGTSAAHLRSKCGASAEQVRSKCGAQCGSRAERVRKNAGGCAARRLLPKTTRNGFFTSQSHYAPPPCAPTNGRPGFPFGFLGAGGRLPKARRGRVSFVQFFFFFFTSQSPKTATKIISKKGGCAAQSTLNFPLKKRNLAGARADPLLRIRGGDCGTAVAPVRHLCGTGAEPVRIACGTGAERERNGCGTGAERVRNVCGTPAERRRICGAASSEESRIFLSEFICFPQKKTHRPPELIKFFMPAARHENKRNSAMCLVGGALARGSRAAAAGSGGGCGFCGVIREGAVASMRVGNTPWFRRVRWALWFCCFTPAPGEEASGSGVARRTRGKLRASPHARRYGRAM